MKNNYDKNGLVDAGRGSIGCGMFQALLAAEAPRGVVVADDQPPGETTAPEAFI